MNDTFQPIAVPEILLPDGAYWWRKPGAGCDVVIAYQGCVAPEAIAGGWATTRSSSH